MCRRPCISGVAIVVVMLTAGCASLPKDTNPSFPLTVEQAREDLRRMANDPRPLRRPVVILGGFIDPGLGGWAIGGELRHYLPRDAKIISVSFLFCDSFDACRRRVIGAVDRAFPTDDPNQTVEVDVIGLSMGGLVGRYAAADFHSTFDVGCSMFDVSSQKNEHRTSNIEHRMFNEITTTQRARSV